MKSQLLSLFVCISLTAHASETSRLQQVETPLHSVQLYLDQAQLTHKTSVSLKPGVNKIVLSGLATTIDEEGIRLEKSGPAKLVSLQQLSIKYMDDLEDIDAYYPEIEKDSVQLLETGIARLNAEIEALEAQKSQYKSGNNLLTSVSVTVQSYTTIVLTLSQKTIERGTLMDRYTRLLARILGTTSFSLVENQINIVIATLFNPEAAYNSELSLSYLSEEALWNPVYDIFGNDENVKLVYKANVLNKTGLRWNKNISLTVSTADPTKKYHNPELEPMYINNNTNGEKNNERNIEQKKIALIKVPEKVIVFPLVLPFHLKALVTLHALTLQVTI